jgi:hypothetical protein
VDNLEARAVLAQRMDSLRSMSYSELKETWLRRPGCDQIQGPSGVEYQVEITVLWETRKSKGLLVAVSVDDGGWRAFSPLNDSFIIDPDGTIAGG